VFTDTAIYCVNGLGDNGVRGVAGSGSNVYAAANGVLSISPPGNRIGVPPSAAPSTPPPAAA
jgi:hypothetical protein